MLLCYNAVIDYYEGKEGASKPANPIFIQAISTSDITNKNRTEQFVGLYKTTGWNTEEWAPDSSTGLTEYVYRAYSYMKINGNIYVSDEPAYFCMYDISQM